MNFIKRFFSGMKQEDSVSETVEVVKPVTEQKVKSTTSSTVERSRMLLKKDFLMSLPPPGLYCMHL